MGNELFIDIELFKGSTNTIFWGISSLKNYFLQYTTNKNLLIKAEKLYRLCGTSSHFKKKLKSYELYTFESILLFTNTVKDQLNDDDLNKYLFCEKYLFKIITLINIILFHRNQKNNDEMNHLSLLLIKYGLSHSGIDTLKCLGLSSTPKTFTKKLKILKNDVKLSNNTINYTKVHWYDNVYRQLKGYSISKSICYTAHGFTNILNNEPIEINYNFDTIPNIHQNLLSNEFKNHTINLIKNTPDIINFPLLDSSNYLSLPLRSSENHPSNGKILFSAESLLETSPANPYGTVCILKH